MEAIMPSWARAAQYNNPFVQPGRWFKGNIHLHSTVSDGRLTPDQAIAWYHERGYHFVALTDHRVLSEARVLSDDFITLSGIEWDGVDREAGLYHLLGLGQQRPPNLDGQRQASMQEAVDELQAAGGLVCLAHPYWSGQMSKDLMSVEKCIGLEIYNGSCEVEDAKGISTVHWDDMLAAGRQLWGLAVDDAHWHHGSRDAGLGWVWVRASKLSQESILKALELGHFYSSTGPQIKELSVDGHEVHVRCSPCVSVDFIGSGHLSHRETARAGDLLTEAHYRLFDHQKYLRVACRDKEGRWAWSNPIISAGNSVPQGTAD
jgi:hypothetical protein